MVQYEYGTNIDTAYINLKKAMDGIRGKFGRDAIAPASTVHRDRAEVKAEQRLPPVD